MLHHPGDVQHDELHPGVKCQHVMQYAMENAMVCLFILSPEFSTCARSMRELMYFQTREREARERGLPVPKLIPVFYRLDVRSCRTDGRFRTINENDENTSAAENFFERMPSGIITAAEIALAMKEVSMRKGIENEDQVTNDYYEDMRQRRSVFIDHLGHIIEHVVTTHNRAAQNETGASMMARHTTSLLHNYSSVKGHILQLRDGCREWWLVDRSSDKYVEENVVRHLIRARLLREALFLVTRPQWIARQLERCGLTSFERDNTWLIMTLGNCSGSVSDRIEAIHELVLFRKCVRAGVRAGLNAIVKNPREVHFQISARMVVYTKKSSSFARSIVEYAEGHILKPRLKPLSACAQQAETVTGMSFPCDGARCIQVVEATDMVIVGCWGGNIAVFNMATCEWKAEWKAHERWVNCLAVTRDARLLVSGSRDKTAKVWDMNNDFDRVAVCQVGNEFKCVDVTPNNRQCVVGHGDGTISVWELKTGRCVVAELGRHESSVESVAVSPDGELVASGDAHGLIKLHSMNSDLGFDSARSVEIEESIGTSFLLRALVRLFHENTGEDESESSNVSLIATLEGHKNSIATLCFRKDGMILVSGSLDDSVRLWEVVRRMQQVEVMYPKSRDLVIYRTVNFRADVRDIVSVGSNGAMYGWRVGREHHEVPKIQFAEGGFLVLDAKIISNTNMIVWCDGKSINVTDVGGDFPAHARGSRHTCKVCAMRVTPDGTRVISGSWDGTMMVWDTATGRQVGATIKGHLDLVGDIAVTPDGKRFVSVSWDKKGYVWDVVTHEQLAVLDGHSYGMNCVEISPDGKRAITGSRNNTVLMWDLEACDGSHQVLEGHSYWVHRLYLAQDRQHFVSISYQDAILWNMITGEMVKRTEKGNAFSISTDNIEYFFDISVISRLQMGNIRLGRKGHDITYQENGTEMVLARMDSHIYSMDFSPITKSLCVGLESGYVGVFKLELEDDDHLVETEECAKQ